MKRLKAYIETSVWNFLLSDKAPEKRAATEVFFRSAETDRYRIFISEVVATEIDDAPTEIRMKLLSTIDRYTPEFLAPDEESDRMIEEYLNGGLLSNNHLVDLSHLAIASVNDMDMLVSWNLKHLVKSRTRMLANAINRKNGYHEIEICTPEEAIESED